MRLSQFSPQKHPCCPKTLQSTSRETTNNLLKQWYQLPRCTNQLHEVYNMLQSSSQMARVQDFLATEECDWRFIPPRGHQFGGLWKAAVISMPYHLRRTQGSLIATYKELSTLLAEIQACINSRPLCALSSNPFNTTFVSWTSNW